MRRPPRLTKRERKAGRPAATSTDEPLKHGFWLVAFLDLLGQQTAFLKTDYIPDHGDPAKVTAFHQEVAASVGAVRSMRTLLDQFREGLQRSDGPGSPLRSLDPSKLAKARELSAHRVHQHHLSDGAVLACALEPSAGHVVPMTAVHDILLTCSTLVLVQLAARRPLRGGIDVGTGMLVDGELFGAGLVKAYQLESKHADYPRLAVGENLVNYLRTCAQRTGTDLKDQFERGHALPLLDLVTNDWDGRFILDYAGQGARRLIGTAPQMRALVQGALAFARASRHEFQVQTGDEAERLYRRYCHLVDYLEPREHLWR